VSEFVDTLTETSCLTHYSCSVSVLSIVCLLQLRGQVEVNDIVVSAPRASLFETHADRHSSLITAGGRSPALAFYPVSREADSFGLTQIAWAVAGIGSSKYYSYILCKTVAT
jgi:hypothetical protein